MSISVIPSDPSQSGFVASDPVSRRSDWSNLPALRLPGISALQDRLPAAMPASSAAAEQFDVLRTRVLGVVEKRSWSRIGLTQPRSRSAAAYAAANLAFSLARRPSLRVVLADLDLRRPRLTRMFGLTQGPDLGMALREGMDLRLAAGCFGDNLAFIGNVVEDPRSAEILQEPGAAASVARLIDILAPDVTLLLLPPVLEGDAGLSSMGMVETLLMVSDGTSTVPLDLRHCDRLLEGGPPVLGVVLVDAEP
jgi:protein-tyrosine kinase